ncbi:hypothetical protein [Streptomyces sp. NPDC058545]|uniref:hypothetical protein n=1 Tax=Streptomyces sp. NPDC058545 TaxID=3346544 RepID=UPI00366528D7
MSAIPRPRDTIESTAPSPSASTVAAGASGPPSARARPRPRNPHLSVDPYFREEMDGFREEMDGGRELGTPLEGRTVGQVIADRSRTRS